MNILVPCGADNLCCIGVIGEDFQVKRLAIQVEV